MLEPHAALCPSVGTHGCRRAGIFAISQMVDKLLWLRSCRLPPRATVLEIQSQVSGILTESDTRMALDRQQLVERKE